MTVTFQDLADANQRREALLDEYVLLIASETSPRTRKAMAQTHNIWTRWVRDWDFDNGVTTEWVGVFDLFDNVAAGYSPAQTHLMAGMLADIDNELLKKELSK